MDALESHLTNIAAYPQTEDSQFYGVLNGFRPAPLFLASADAAVQALSPHTLLCFFYSFNPAQSQPNQDHRSRQLKADRCEWWSAHFRLCPRPPHSCWYDSLFSCFFFGCGLLSVSLHSLVTACLRCSIFLCACGFCCFFSFLLKLASIKYSFLCDQQVMSSKNVRAHWIPILAPSLEHKLCWIIHLNYYCVLNKKSAIDINCVVKQSETCMEISIKLSMLFRWLVSWVPMVKTNGLVEKRYAYIWYSQTLWHSVSGGIHFQDFTWNFDLI